ncbi:hypothetical protein GQ55_1G036000 [Panicum hallii var. hallii]|uniref:non-specific serine/threonine protein kinase n=1 Tax=Panicum hallii var. hallii TaxID=1504633 RepID=A0A2T7F1Z2_9POAL|nr:hypothetical protein GQ55_1G036000 [Panicum hallii var. hallii]
MKLFVAVLLFYILKHTSGQPDIRGFISIDCGIPDNSSYQDLTSSIVYVSDHDFISLGQNRNISSDYIKPSLAWRNYNVRFFPDGTRNCYTLRSLVAGNKYFVRATFYYGNYDGLNKLPVFDLYLGANYWHEVKFRGSSAVNWMDIIVVAPADYLQVCLSTLYPQSNSSQYIVLINSNRFNMGPTDNNIVRTTPARTREGNGKSPQRQQLLQVADLFLLEDIAWETVMQTAATPVNGSRIDFSWDPSDPSVNISSRYFFVFYFAELQSVASNALRQFDIIVNNSTWNPQPYTPPFLFADSISGTVQGQERYNISLVATKNATLPPILNAMEMYLIKPISLNPRAMMAIQETFGVSKNWMGDPCSPKAFAWEGLNCTYPPAGLSRITALNLSSNGLVGSIATYFGDLKALQYLDLSHNNLYGSIPDVLGQLPLLVFLDLSSNDLSGPIPYSLLRKSHNGTLSIRLGNNANLCGNGTTTTCGSGRKKMKGALLTAIVIPIVAVIALFVLSIFLLCKEKAKRLEKGGFEAVFLGYLENGNPVAVKVRSESSSQGGKEFLAEAQHLTRIHHMNLVSLIGYCKDKNHLALVYEYMPEGNLQDHLRDTSTSKSLTWEQRLQIALDAAQGLEYLHVGCKPALIHRDVKSRNIL